MSYPKASRMRLFSLLLTVCLCLFLCGTGALSVFAYRNPTALPTNPWGIGDPYILKHNGVYYMYATVTRNVQVWSSRDLVRWSAPTVCLKGELNPYAPEVRYYDGVFYMYTAPDGGGHVIYTATSPTGPFSAATGNLGDSFDGTVMMDGDNKIYFVAPETGKMIAREMKNFTAFNTAVSKKTLTPHVADRWTEGPTLFKRLGKYYLTYTGNHVWEASYHIEYALSDAPLSGWTEPADNKVLLDIEGAIKGPGHNSIFIGPDLDTYYITYHSIKEFVKDKSVRRQMNFDKIVWNGEKLVVQGPTSWQVDDPALPAFYDYFDAGSTAAWNASGNWNGESGSVNSQNGTLLSKESTGAVFTAEYNFTADTGSGTAAVLFGYKDDQNYGRVWIDKAAGALKAEQIQNGRTVWSGSSALYSFFNYTALHTVRVQQSADTLRIVLDEVERIVAPRAASAGGRIGYRTNGVRLTAHYTAFSNKALGSADHENYAPLPGTVEAVHYQNRAASLPTVGAAGGELGSAVKLTAGDVVTYNVNVEKQTTYSLALSVADVAENTALEILIDGKTAAKITLPAVSAGAYRSLPVRGLTLPAGKHQLSFRVTEGHLEFYEFNVSRDAGTGAVSSDFESADCDGDGVKFVNRGTGAVNGLLAEGWAGGNLDLSKKYTLTLYVKSTGFQGADISVFATTAAGDNKLAAKDTSLQQPLGGWTKLEFTDLSPKKTGPNPSVGDIGFKLWANTGSATGYGIELDAVTVTDQTTGKVIPYDLTELKMHGGRVVTGADGDGVNWLQFEQAPVLADGTARYFAASTPAFGKLLSGHLTDTDYAVEADITVGQSNAAAGLLFRVTHADNGYNPAENVNNSSYHQGYFLCVSVGKVTLYKHDFGDVQLLKTVNTSAVAVGRTAHVKVTAVGDRFTAYIDGTEVLRFIDTSHPLLTGRAGLRTNSTDVRFDNYKVTAVAQPLEVTYIRADGSGTATPPTSAPTASEPTVPSRNPGTSAPNETPATTGSSASTADGGTETTPAVTNATPSDGTDTIPTATVPAATEETPPGENELQTVLLWFVAATVAAILFFLYYRKTHSKKEG